MFLLEIALMGGLLSVLVFIHFFVDWIFQSHAEAMVKHNTPRVRAKHCFIYTMGFLPILLLFHLTPLELFGSLNLLFWSHFVEDTYVPVYLWAKYIRKPPEMSKPSMTSVTPDGYIHVSAPDPKKGFAEFVQTPMGKILMIAIDQIIHIAFLIPIAWIMMTHLGD